MKGLSFGTSKSNKVPDTNERWYALINANKSLLAGVKTAVTILVCQQHTIDNIPSPKAITTRIFVSLKFRELAEIFDQTSATNTVVGNGVSN
jgi:hypothetical protein